VAVGAGVGVGVGLGVEEGPRRMAVGSGGAPLGVTVELPHAAVSKATMSKAAEEP
jgi:hypothetical protein